MTVRERLEDARILATAGQQEGAFIQVLIATAATSRKRYKQEIWDDGESFKNFIYDEMGVITGGPKYGVELPFLGKKTPLEDILYHHLRCQLLHEGTMPETIVFTRPKHNNGTTYNYLHLGSPLGLPEGWIERLATAVWLAPENDDLWKDESERRQKAIEQLGESHHDRSYCRRPGKRTKKDKGKDERISWTHAGVNIRLSYPPSTTRLQLADSLEQQVRRLRHEN